MGGRSTQNAAASSPHSFTRSLSGFGVIILTLSVLSPGVSIFVSGGTILQQAGTGAVLAFLIGSLVCYCQTSLIAELGAAYPTAGYDYAAIGHAIGDWAGATCYIASIASLPLFLNTSAVGIAIYLHPFGLPLGDDAVTLLMVAIITGLSMLNIRSSEHITGIFMAIEIAALLLVAALGIFHAQPDAAARVMPPFHIENGLWLATGIGVLGIAVNNASWAIAGASQAMVFSEDMKYPRTIGRIIMIAFLLTVVLETAPVIGTIIGSHDLKAVLGNDAPFETFLRQYLSEGSLRLVSLAIAIAIAIFNACLAGFVGYGRNVFAMGRTKLFAGPINRAVMLLIPCTQAPWCSIAIIGIATAIATYLPMYLKILLLSGNYTVLTFFYVWGVFAGRRSGRTGTLAHSFRSPLYPLMPLLGVGIVIGEVIILWNDAAMGRKSLLVCGGVYLLAFAYYKLVLVRRPEGWAMIGPKDIDAMTIS